MSCSREFFKGIFFRKFSFFNTFWTPIAEKTGRSTKTFQRGCQNCLPPVHSKFLRDTIFHEFFLKHSGPLSNEIPGLCQESLGRIVEFAFYGSRGIIETDFKKLFCFDRFQTLSKKSSISC